LLAWWSNSPSNHAPALHAGNAASNTAGKTSASRALSASLAQSFCAVKRVAGAWQPCAGDIPPAHSELLVLDDPSDLRDLEFAIILYEFDNSGRTENGILQFLVLYGILH